MHTPRSVGSRGLIARSRLGRALKGLHGRLYRVVEVFRPCSRRERPLRARKRRGWGTMELGNLVAVPALQMSQVPARGVRKAALREAGQEISPLTSVVVVPPIGIEIAVLTAVRLRVIHSGAATGRVHDHPAVRPLLEVSEPQKDD